MEQTSDPNGWGCRFNAHWGNILLLDFLCSYIKASDTNIAISANFGDFVKTLQLQFHFTVPYYHF